jgi:hypothetical protein
MRSNARLGTSRHGSPHPCKDAGWVRIVWQVSTVRRWSASTLSTGAAYTRDLGVPTGGFKFGERGGHIVGPPVPIHQLMLLRTSRTARSALTHDTCYWGHLAQHGAPSRMIRVTEDISHSTERPHAGYVLLRTSRTARSALMRVPHTLSDNLQIKYFWGHVVMNIFLLLYVELVPKIHPHLPFTPYITHLEQEVLGRINRIFS